MPYIELGGKHKGIKVLVDQDDADKYGKVSWKLSNSGYAFRTPTKSFYLHRLIVNCPIGMTVDHINGNKLDNRKCNLRICTRNENQYNKSGNFKGNRISKYKGVSPHKNSKWRARISYNGKQKTLGYFDSEIIAARAYNMAAKKYHGEYAVINEVLV